MPDNPEAQSTLLSAFGALVNFACEERTSDVLIENGNYQSRTEYSKTQKDDITYFHKLKHMYISDAFY